MSTPIRLGAADRHQTDVVFLALRLPAKPSRWPSLVLRDELVEGRLLDACDIFRWPVRASTQSQVPPRPPTPILNQPWRECKIAASKTQRGHRASRRCLMLAVSRRTRRRVSEPAAAMPPCVDGSELARTFSRLQNGSVRPCVRPFSAVHMTAGHNALRGSGPDR